MTFSWPRCREVALALAAVVGLLSALYGWSVDVRKKEMELALMRYQLLQARDAIGVLMDTTRGEP